MKRAAICEGIARLEEDEVLRDAYLIFVNEDVFQICVTVKNVCVWITVARFHVIVLKSHLPELSQRLSQTKVHGPFFFAESTIIHIMYLIFVQR